MAGRRPLEQAIKNPCQHILISGGGGLLAGRLAQYLHQSGYKVTLASRGDRLSKALSNDIRYAHLNWANSDALEDVCSTVDVVIHAAGMNSGACALAPLEANAVNAENTNRFIKAAGKAGVSTFIYFSTIHVYDSNLTGFYDETASLGNQHPYATSKAGGEQAVREVSDLGYIDGFVLRLANAIGAPIDNNADCWMLIVNDLCKQAVTTGKLMLKSRTPQNRDYIPISGLCAVVDGFISADPDCIKERIFNISSGKSYSILEIANLIQDRCMSKYKFKPQIQHRMEPQKGIHDELIIANQRLLATDITMPDDLSGEIDNLLDFCKENFEFFS